MYRTSLPALLGALTLAAALPAQAARPVLTIAELQTLPPEAQRAYVQERVALQRSQAALTGDTTGPQLTGFSLKANAAAGSQLTAKVQATDDLSGVRGMYFYAFGPDNAISMNLYWQLPATANQGIAVGEINRFAEPGSYSAVWGYLYDAAGNYTYLNASDFSALGNATVQVSNGKAIDSQPPTLGTGKLLTTRLSLADRLPGTDQPAYAGAELSGTDSGQSGTSGVREMNLEFCLLDNSRCFWFYGNTGAQGLDKLKLNVGGQPAMATSVPGRYYVKQAILTDWSMHSSLYTSTRFGGTTDFATVFSNGDSIVLRP